MIGRAERGFSLIEVMIATAIAAVVTTSAMQLLTSTTRNYSRQQNQNDVVWQGRAAIDLMVRELRMAGYPAQSNYAGTSGVTPATSNLAALPFMTTTATNTVFEADLDGDGVVERVEYRLNGTTLERSDVPKNSDGSVAAAQYQTVATNMANGGTPIFTYTTDPNSNVAAPGNTNSVRVQLVLRTAYPDPVNRQYRTFQFNGIAYRQNPDH